MKNFLILLFLVVNFTAFSQYREPYLYVCNYHNPIKITTRQLPILDSLYDGMTINIKNGYGKEVPVVVSFYGDVSEIEYFKWMGLYVDMNRDGPYERLEYTKTWVPETIRVWSEEEGYIYVGFNGYAKDRRGVDTHASFGYYISLADTTFHRIIHDEKTKKKVLKEIMKCKKKGTFSR